MRWTPKWSTSKKGNEHDFPDWLVENSNKYKKKMVKRGRFFLEKNQLYAYCSNVLHLIKAKKGID